MGSPMSVPLTKAAGSTAPAAFPPGLGERDHCQGPCWGYPGSSGSWEMGHLCQEQPSHSLQCVPGVFVANTATLNAVAADFCNISNEAG